MIFEFVIVMRDEIPHFKNWTLPKISVVSMIKMNSRNRFFGLKFSSQF